MTGLLRKLANLPLFQRTRQFDADGRQLSRRAETTATSDTNQGQVPAVKIIVYTKQWCGWCDEVLDLLRDRGIAFEEREVYSNRQYFEEMVQKSGQWRAPVVEIDGHILSDTDADEVDRYLSQLAQSVPAA